MFTLIVRYTFNSDSTLSDYHRMQREEEVSEGIKRTKQHERNSVEESQYSAGRQAGI